MVKISVVVPCYNEQKLIVGTYRKLKSLLKKICKSYFPEIWDYELIFINDGSNDKTGGILEKLAKGDSQIIVINFSRNFGQEMAMKAGLRRAKGNAVITVDCDLQEPLETFYEMISKWQEGSVVVHGVRSARCGESFFKKSTSWLFHRIFKKLSGLDIPLDSGNFRLIDQSIYTQINNMSDHTRYLRGLSASFGGRQECVKCSCSVRRDKSKYGIIKLLDIALDSLVLFSKNPFRLILLNSLLVFGIDFIYILVLIFLKLNNNIDIDILNYLLILALFISCQISFGFAIIGEYVFKIHKETKGGFEYVISNTINFESDQVKLNK